MLAIFFYSSKSLFSPVRVRLQILKAAFRIHNCCFWQQHSSPTIHQNQFNLPAFHSQQHYFLYTRFNIAYLKTIYLLLKINLHFKVYLRVEILIFQVHQTSLPRHIIIDLIIGGVKHNDQWDRNKDDKTIGTIILIPFVPANQRLDYHRQQRAGTDRKVRTRVLSEWGSFGQPNKRRPRQFEHQSIRKESWLTHRLYQWSI